MDERKKDFQTDILQKPSFKNIGWLAVVCFLCTLLLANQTHRYDLILRSHGGSGILGLELAFFEKEAKEIIAQWQGARPEESRDTEGAQTCQGLVCAERLQQWDWFLILSYTCTLLATILALIRVVGIKVGSRSRIIFALPLIIAFCDGLENILIAAFLSNTLEIGQWPVFVMSLLASCKFLLLCMVLVAMVYVAGFWLMARAGRVEDSEGDPKILKNLDEIRADECKYLHFRRIKAGVEEGQPYTGLASSGGGIRSATVNLGVIERFLEGDLLHRVDYHSTVSGGGYAGSALSSLLSFKMRRKEDAKSGMRKETPEEDSQYCFVEGDVAHFDCADRARRPFPLNIPGYPDNAPEWLSRQMVLTHIRSYGDYLVRRRRLLSRDVLRVLGTLGQGMAGTFGMFVFCLMTCASLCFTLLAIVDHRKGGNNLGLGMDGGTFGCFLDSALNNWYGVLILGIGYTILLLQTASLVQRALPEKLFHRDGDTREDCMQYRLLWIMGILFTVAAFFLPTIFITRLGVLAPASFLAGATIVAASSYLLLCLTSDAFRLWALSDYSSCTSRSLYSAILGLLLCLTILAVLIGILPRFVSLLMMSHEGIRLDPQSIWSTSGLGIFSLIAAGLVTWWEKAVAVGEKNKELLEMMNKGRKLQGVVKRFLLAIPILLLTGILLLVCAACIVRLSVWLDGLLSIWMLSEVPRFFPYAVLTMFFSLFLLFSGYVFDFNKLSMHYFYRDRLAEAYLSTTGPVVEGSHTLEMKRDNIEMKLSDLHGSWQGSTALPREQVPAIISQRLYGPSKQSQQKAEMLNAIMDLRWITPDLLNRIPLPGKFKTLFHLEMEVETEFLTDAATSAPYHLYCACLNLTTDRNMLRRTRKSDIFLFSKLYCGSKTTGFLPTRMYRKDETKVARAMTISGAAIDSFLGRSTFFAQSFAMTLFNIRLGQWMENPGYMHGTHTHKQESGIFWPAYLFMEACGMSDSRRRLVHLSDGGHTGDNLGIVPLLERGCGLIIAVDAEADPDYRFTSFLTALRYLETDDHIRVRIDLDQMCPDRKTGFCRAPFTLGEIEYLDASKAVVAKGCLLVLKAAVAEDMSLQLRKHKEQFPLFPQETTGDQFFSEDQFEAYRGLGREVADAVFKALPSLATGIDCGRLREEYSAWARNNL